MKLSDYETYKIDIIDTVIYSTMEFLRGKEYSIFICQFNQT